jgi:glutamate synthase (NADPH/NADH) small chain
MDQKELRVLEDKCIQECAPTCTARCPVHVDVRTMTAAVGNGNVTAALEAFMKTVPFPGIISHVCDRPCEDVCVYGQIGNPIAIRAIERTCVEHGKRPKVQQPHRRRSEQVAVIGGGICGLTAAHDLARKGYQVSLFEAGDQLGGSLWRAGRDYLPAEVIQTDLEVIWALDIDVHLRTHIDTPGTNLLDDFDAVYVATGPVDGVLAGLPHDERDVVTVDPITFGTAIEGIFAGGGLLWGPEMHSSITSISEGRRAAISIDRYLQEVSLTASRAGEGSYESCLYTNLDEVEVRPRIEMGHPDVGYEWYEAMLEAQRCMQCECMECVKVCQYLEDYRKYPRKYVREIYNNLSIVQGTRHANKFINSCSTCGLCAEVCPTDLDMGEIVLEARRTMVEQGRMPPSAHDFALRDMQFSNGDKFALAKNPPAATSSDYVLFPGCQLSASSPEHVERLFGHLTTSLPDDDVGLMLGCCGAPARWAGRTDLFDQAIERWRSELAALGNPTVILPCSSCFQVFRTSLPDVAIVSLWELLDREGAMPQSVAQDPRTVSIHDPCTTRHETGIHDSIRHLVDAMGYEIDELEASREKTSCCSYGGHTWLANRDLSTRIIERRIAENDADYVTYCAMCRDFFAAKGKRTLHVLDLIFESDVDGRAERIGPGYSQRHENRARLKRRMLKEIWGETMAGDERHEMITLRMTNEVTARLDERLILIEDIQRVIEYAERTGRRLSHRDTGHFLAYHKPDAVTYWVEYLPTGDGAFEVFNAYSHRMEIPGSTEP